MNKICFREEAKDWNEALPIGNGFIGAMVFGKIGTERLQINEDSVWTGSFMERVNPDARENYPKVRELLLNGEIEQAELLAERSMYATYPHMRHYQTLGDVWIDFYKQRGKTIFKKDQGGLLSVQHESVEVQTYNRELDISRAVGKIQYESEKGKYEREFFASNPDHIIVYQMKSIDGELLNFDLSLTRKDNRSGRGSSFCDGTEVLDGNKIRLYGKQGGDHGIAFELLVQVRTKNGKISRMGSHLLVEDAKEATLFITARTSFRSEQPLQWCMDVLSNAEKESYGTLQERHIKDYLSYYEKSNLKLNYKDSYEHLTTPERLEQMRNGIEDIELINTYYNFARYLLISSSREGSLPSNLQGIWNEEFEPMWGSKYTININIQMNYWMAEKTGLQALHLPLLEHLKRMHPRGKEVAASMYHVEGFCCHHNTDIWGDCAPQDYHTSSTIWPMGGAWLCLHIYEHYQYTKDKGFLEEYFPILKDSVQFFMNYMVQNSDGKWVTGPSSSPENIYITAKNQYGCLCMGPTMDIEIVRELFSNYLKTVEILEKEEPLTGLVKDRIENLPKLKVGKYGQIQEWDQDYEELEVGHRHISQLFALYPAQQIRKDQTPKLAQAAEKTLDRRLENGGGHTGWSKAWIILFFARLWKKEKAYQNLQELLAEATLDNLLDNHPPFQIDGNFGGACGILEMIVQDYQDVVYLLPALPQEMPDGNVSGIRTKSGFILNMEWSGCRVKSVEVESVHGTQITIVNETLESRKISEKGEKKVIVFE